MHPIMHLPTANSPFLRRLQCSLNFSLIKLHKIHPGSNFRNKSSSVIWKIAKTHPATRQRGKHFRQCM